MPIGDTKWKLDTLHNLWTKAEVEIDEEGKAERDLTRGEDEQVEEDTMLNQLEKEDLQEMMAQAMRTALNTKPVAERWRNKKIIKQDETKYYHTMPRLGPNQGNLTHNEETTELGEIQIGKIGPHQSFR